MGRATVEAPGRRSSHALDQKFDPGFSGIFRHKWDLRLPDPEYLTEIADGLWTTIDPMSTRGCQSCSGLQARAVDPHRS